MFNTRQGFPLGGFFRVMMVLSAAGALATIGCAISLVVWLSTHVRIG